MRDYYAILGVDRQAGDEDIKTAFRKLAKNYHPDRNPGDAWAERRFKEVNEAYETLADETRRAGYDAEIEAEDESDLGGAYSSDMSWGEPASSPREASWPEPDPFPGPPRPPSWPAFWNISIAVGSLLLVGAVAVALTLVPDGREFEKIANQPLGAAEPAREEARAVPPEPLATTSPESGAEHGATINGEPHSGEPVDVPAPREREPDLVEQAWTSVRDARDTPTLARFMDRHPGTSQAREAQSIVADLINGENQAPPLEALVQEFPSGPVADLARSRLEELRSEATAAEESAWTAAARQGSASGFVTFLGNYPRSRHVAEAKGRLESLGLIEAAVGSGAEKKTRWLRAIDTFRDCQHCPQMVVARARKTAPPDFDAKVRAALPGPFAIGKSRVSTSEWAVCARDRECRDEPRQDGPSAGAVSEVSWSDAQSYVRWLGKRTGHSYRLLTEMEWRYAIRLKLVAADPVSGPAPTDTAGYTAAPGGPPPIPDGTDSPGAGEKDLSRLGGSAVEWVSDCWSEESPGRQRAAAPLPSAEGLCAERVLLARRGREFERFGDVPGSREDGYAFRVARSLE